MEKLFFRLLCFCAFCSFMTTMQAQRNYRPGFIITLQKDTVYGQIDYRTDKMNGLHCVFRKDSTSQAKTYNPFDILGYRFTDDGKMYVSKSVTLTAEASQDIFLECLVKGIKSLYYMEAPANGMPIYFIEDGDILVKVDAPKLAEKVTSFQFKGEVDRYIPILHYVFSDCPALKSQIDCTKFNHKSLIKLTKKYHYAMCTSNEDCVEFVAKEDKDRVQIRLTPYGGVMQYVLPQGFFDSSFQRPQLSYLFGINLAVSSRRWMSSVSGIVDLSISRLATTDGTYNYSGILFSPQLGLRYTHPKGSIHPFIGLGMDMSILVTSESNNKYRNIQKGGYPGYYAELGLDVPLSEKKKQALNIRFQFKNIRDIEGKSNFAYGWSGAIGYIFQVR